MVAVFCTVSVVGVVDFTGAGTACKVTAMRNPAAMALAESGAQRRNMATHRTQRGSVQYWEFNSARRSRFLNSQSGSADGTAWRSRSSTLRLFGSIGVRSKYVAKVIESAVQMGFYGIFRNFHGSRDLLI